LASHSGDDLDSLGVKGIVLTMKDDKQNEDNEMLPEYDLSKLKLVGRGIYAERYRAGVKFVIRNDEDCIDKNDNKVEQGGEG